jgi:putative endonuclease
MGFTYILQCADGTYYIGSTNNLQKRLKQHNTAKSGAHYTKIRRPVVLVHVEECESLSAARKKEAQWKQLKRSEKEMLISGTMSGNMSAKKSKSRSGKKSTKNLIERARKRAQQTHQSFVKKFPHIAAKLKTLDFEIKDLRRHTTKMISAAAIGAAVIAVAPTIQQTVQPQYQEQVGEQPSDLEAALKNRLTSILPEHIGALDPQTETQISDIIKKTLNINAFATLDGNHLNTSYGYTGAEQHLPRFPGDSIDQHDELQIKGITMGTGAFGYFASTKVSMTPEDVLREKYYVAVQTMYLPEWATQARYLKDWYRFRKVLVINPANGKSVVAVIGDAGPAGWTGKQYGASPEIMAYLALNHGKQKGAVLIFFVDDNERNVALGPVTFSSSGFLAKR